MKLELCLQGEREGMLNVFLFFFFLLLEKRGYVNCWWSGLEITVEWRKSVELGVRLLALRHDETISLMAGYNGSVDSASGENNSRENFLLIFNRNVNSNHIQLLQIKDFTFNWNRRSKIGLDCNKVLFLSLKKPL